LIFVAAIAGIFSAASGFDFIINNYLKVTAFTVLVLSITLNLVIEINEKLSERENEAKETITKALDIASLTIGRGKKDQIRAYVFMRNKRNPNQIEIRFHSSIMEKFPDAEIRYEKWQGCVGKAWGYETGVVASANQLTFEKSKEWNLTEKQFLLTKEIKSIIAWPIMNPFTEGQILGILSFDTTSDLSDFFISEQARILVADMSGFIGELLIVYGLERPLNQSEKDNKIPSYDKQVRPSKLSIELIKNFVQAGYWPPPDGVVVIPEIRFSQEGVDSLFHSLARVLLPQKMNMVERARKK
jgi:hypothetical protein